MQQHINKKMLAQLILEADDKVVQRVSKQGYTQRTRIMLDPNHPTTVRAKVANSSGKVYDVKIDTDSRDRSCSCPAHRFYRDTPCKHTVAAASAVALVAPK
jgi:uncharacterized Zn finger protein